MGTKLSSFIFGAARHIKLFIEELGIHYSEPEGGLFLLAKSPIKDCDLWVSTLLKHGVAVVPGSLYGTSDYFRISTTIGKQQINDSRDCWEAALAELSC